MVNPFSRGGRALQRQRVRSLVGSRMVDSQLERRQLEELLLLERGKAIRNLVTQVTHHLRVAASHACCSCFPPHICNDGKTIYSPRLDFQFEEPDGGRITLDRGRRWVLVYADAKGWMDDKQRLGYKLFAAIHGHEIRLYTKSGRR